MKFLEALGKNARTIIAVSVIYLSFGFLFMVARMPIPVDNRDLVMLSAGIVLGVVATVTAYYFGSSKDKSDQEKADIAEKIATATTTTLTKAEDKPEPDV